VQLRRNKNLFDRAGARVVMVGMGTVEQTAAFKRKFDIPYAMVSDPERKLYRKYQIGFMPLASIFSPRVMARTVSALAKGRGVGIPYGDVRQLSAVFVIEIDGTISYGHYAKDASDHPQAREILDHIG
jgi:peroxiredoxin